MKFYSKKNSQLGGSDLQIASARLRAFSLAEALVALVIMAFICASVLVVINRSIASASDSVLQMQAFEVARNNMEKLLAKSSAKEMVEFGTSEKYPAIQWQTTVETFYEPLTSAMWLQAVCSAEYTDAEGDEQNIELTHWLTNLTKAELAKILERKLLARQTSGGPDEKPGPDDKPEPDEEPKPDEEPVDCDSLPFCERAFCYFEQYGGLPPGMGWEELQRFMNECWSLL